MVQRVGVCRRRLPPLPPPLPRQNLHSRAVVRTRPTRVRSSSSRLPRASSSTHSQRESVSTRPTKSTPRFATLSRAGVLGNATTATTNHHHHHHHRPSGRGRHHHPYEKVSSYSSFFSKETTTPLLKPLFSPLFLRRHNGHQQRSFFHDVCTLLSTKNRTEFFFFGVFFCLFFVSNV